MTTKTVTAYNAATQSTAVTNPWGRAVPVGTFTSQGYLSVGTTSSFAFLHQANTTTKWSVCFWYKCNSFTFNHVVFNTSNAMGNASQMGCALTINTNRTVTFKMTSTTVNQPYINGTTSGTVPNDTNWHYMVVNFDNTVTSNNVRIYVDNSELTSSITKTAYTPSGSSTTYHELFISADDDGTGWMAGYLSDFVIYKNINMPTTIPDTYNLITDNTELALRMNGSGTTFVDSSMDTFAMIRSGLEWL